MNLGDVVDRLKANRAIHLAALEQKFTGIIAIHINPHTDTVEGVLFLKSREEVTAWEGEILKGMIMDFMAKGAAQLAALGLARGGFQVHRKWFINGKPLSRVYQNYFYDAYTSVQALLN
jgi:hypothetical protein